MKSKAFVIVFACVFLITAATPAFADKSSPNLRKAWPRICKALNSGDPVTMAGIFAQDAVMIASGEPEPIKGRAAVLQYYKHILQGVPDLGFKTDSIHYAGHTIIVEFVCSGTNSGTWAGPDGDIQPTGKHFNTPLAMFLKITPEGLIAENRIYYDTLDHMKQLGMVK